MRCPFCDEEGDKVVDSRAAQEGRAIRRRRECLSCHERFTTYEYIEQAAITVIKSDNRREQFDPNKILHGIKLACNKRPISAKQMEALSQQVEAEVSTHRGNEIPSQEIGEMVMARLREVDEIAYVRFASVYRKFADKQEFLEEMKRLLE